jgi:hypothetical protein
MSARKAPEPSAPAMATAPPVRKKPRAPRVHLTHLEIRRGETLRLRIAIADDAIAEAGDELGALIKKISPSTKTSVIAEPEPTPDPDFVVSRSHMDNADAYHATLRTHLADLFSSLCDTSLADALEIAREESARRADGMN